MRPSPETLAEIEALAEAAHGGEWIARAIGPGQNRIDAPDSGWAIPQVVGAGTWSDLSYIAALHNAFPELMAYIRDLERVAEAAIDQHHKCDPVDCAIAEALAALDIPGGTGETG